MEESHLSAQEEVRGEDGPVLEGKDEGSEEVKAPVVAGNRVQVEACEMTMQSVMAGCEVQPPVVAGQAAACVAGMEVPSVKRGANLNDPSNEEGSAGKPAMSFWCNAEVLEFEFKCDFLKMFQTEKLFQVAFCERCTEVTLLRPSVLQLGISVMQLLLCSPRDGKSMCQWFEQQFSLSSTTPIRVRDVLPLPLTPVGAAMKLVARMEATQSGLLVASNLSTGPSKKKGRQQLGRLVREGSRQLWRLLVIVVLNGMNDDWVYRSWKSEKHTPTQAAAIDVINRWIDGFCQEPLKEVTLPVFSELVQSRSIDYSGDEVGHALPLRLEELLPGLPIRGVAGSLSAAAAATGGIKDWVCDPSLTLKPPEQWPKVVPKARINASKTEWYRVCRVLFDRGIIEAIPLENVFHAGGVPVLNGAFSVEKKVKQREVKNVLPD